MCSSCFFSFSQRLFYRFSTQFFVLKSKSSISRFASFVSTVISIWEHVSYKIQKTTKQTSEKKIFSFEQKKKYELVSVFKLLIKTAFPISEFNVKIVDEAIDFYVVKTYDYNDCVYNVPDKMAKPPSTDKMVKNSIIFSYF